MVLCYLHIGVDDLFPGSALVTWGFKGSNPCVATNCIKMKIDYFVVAVVALAIAGLMIWLIKRNVHDEKKIEGKGNPTKTDPEKTMEEL